MNIDKLVPIINEKAFCAGVAAEGFAPAIATALLPLFPKFEQVAFYTPDIDAAKKSYLALGCTEWSDDVVTGRARVGSGASLVTGIATAELAFNYQLGCELELIRYHSSLNWHHFRGRIQVDGSCREMFASHMSYHVEHIEDEVERLVHNGLNLVQEVTTISHTNKFLIDNGRKYYYAIFDTRHLLGFDVKIIQRRAQKKSINLAGGE